MQHLIVCKILFFKDIQQILFGIFEFRSSPENALAACAHLKRRHLGEHPGGFAKGITSAVQYDVQGVTYMLPCVSKSRAVSGESSLKASVLQKTQRTRKRSGLYTMSKWRTISSNWSFASVPSTKTTWQSFRQNKIAQIGMQFGHLLLR